MNIIQLLISLIPIIGPLVLLVGLRKSAKFGMTISMILMIVFGFLIWQINVNVLFASAIIGLHKSITILYILLGALSLVQTLQHTKAIVRINNGFKAIHEDKRVLIIIIAFLFGGLIEGASGFGTPATITGPLMVTIGINPLIAATLALIADSVPVSFGAVGTPISVGLSNVAVSGNVVANTVTLIDLFAGSFIPLSLVAVYVFLNKEYKDNRLKSFIEMVPFALLSGVVYTLIAFASSRLFGYEFVSIISPIVTLLVVSMIARKGILVPEHHVDVKPVNEMSLFKAWSPYLVVVLLLLLTRTMQPIKSFLLSINFLNINNVFSTGINSNFEFLYSPGTVLLLAALFASLYQTKKIKSFTQSINASKDVLINAALALVPTLIMVTIFSNSAANGSGLSSMPEYIAFTLSDVFDQYWSLASPFLGALGSFVSGSATVSNLTFAEVQSIIATNTGVNSTVIISLQVIGAAIGNMICVHNVVAASAVVGLNNKEGLIIKKTIVVALAYLALVAIVGLILI